MLIEKNVPLQSFNTFGIVAKASVMVRVQSAADVDALLADPGLKAAPKFLIF